jgi:hypothetical protein
MTDIIISSAITPVQFVPITLPAPQQISGKFGSGKPTALTWRDSSVRPMLAQLQAIEARRISGGQPRRNLSGFYDALAEFGAQLVTVTLSEGTSMSETGIISIVAADAGPGGPLVQNTSLVIFPCQRLRYYGLSQFQSV